MGRRERKQFQAAAGAAATADPMKDVDVRITPQELMRMKAVVMDGDRDDALAYISELLGRAESELHSGIKSHLDK